MTFRFGNLGIQWLGYQRSLSCNTFCVCARYHFFRTLIWRCISQTICFLYLREEKTSLLVLLPTGFGVLVELWKLTKALKVRWILRNGFLPWYVNLLRHPLKILWFSFRPLIGTTTKDEQRTEELDTEAMRHLAKLMIPLCVCGAIYRRVSNVDKDSFMFVVHSEL